jgi:hypothetical protein
LSGQRIITGFMIVVNETQIGPRSPEKSVRKMLDVVYFSPSASRHDLRDFMNARSVAVNRASIGEINLAALSRVVRSSAREQSTGVFLASRAMMSSSALGPMRGDRHQGLRRRPA